MPVFFSKPAVGRLRTFRLARPDPSGSEYFEVAGIPVSKSDTAKVSVVSSFRLFDTAASAGASFDPPKITVTVVGNDKALPSDARTVKVLAPVPFSSGM